MPLCNDCYYEPWDSRSPVSEHEYLERLESIGVSPTGEGLESVCIGSPFRVPLPHMIKLCCLESQMCENQGVKFQSLHDKSEAEVAINGARAAVYREAGLPSIG